MLDLVLVGLIVLTVLVASATVASLSLAPWVPTRSRDLERGLRLAAVKTGERFYDLGCGDGRVVIEAARRGAKAVGYELSVAMYAFCRLRRRPGAEFRFGDALKADLSDADVVYIFGRPETVKGRLQAKLEAELKPGTRVVSYAFSFAPWTPAAVDRPDPKRDFPIYLYIR